MTKERIELSPTSNDKILTKDGKKYRLLKEVVEKGHIKKVIFEELDEAAYEKQLDEITSYLIDKSELDAKTILKDVLKQLDTDYLNKLSGEVKKESPVEVVPGCLSLKIGKRRIEII